MKNFLLAAMLMVGHQLTAQLHPVSLEQKIEKAPLIARGKVVAQKSYKDSHGNIFTANIVAVSKTYKGKKYSKIVVVTYGGVIGDIAVTHEEAISLTPGQEGIFFLTTTDIEPIRLRAYRYPNFVVYASRQGFIQTVLDPATGKWKGWDPFNKYADVEAEVVKKIGGL